MDTLKKTTVTTVTVTNGNNYSPKRLKYNKIQISTSSSSTKPNLEKGTKSINFPF